MPSHLTASSPARCRVVRPPGNLDRGQSFTIWLIVCFAVPQLQDGSGILCQRERFAAHCPWPVLKWFKFAHRCRGKLKPGGRAVGSSTKDWLITSVPSHSLHHSSRADTSSRGTSNHTGCRDGRRAAGWFSMSAWSGKPSFLRILASSFVASFWQGWGGAMWLRTGNHGSGVGRIVMYTGIILKWKKLTTFKPCRIVYSVLATFNHNGSGNSCEYVTSITHSQAALHSRKIHTRNTESILVPMHQWPGINH